MTAIPFGEWKPDLADLQAASTKTVLNVVPRADGYGPAKDYSAYSSALVSGNDTYTKVLLHFDGTDASTTITDSNSGGSAHTWTANGNAQIDTAQSKFGGASGLFDGTGDYVTASDHADFTLGSGDWTVDVWFRVAGGDGSTLRLAGQSDSSLTSTTRTFMITRTAANIIQAQAFVGSTGTVCTGTTQFTTAVNTGWHHVAMVRSGNTLKLFIDGAQEGGDQSITGTVNDSANALSVGRLGEEGANYFNGWLEEFRLSVGVARWTTTFTPPRSPYGTAAEGACRGFFRAIKTDGSSAIFAGTSTKLFQLDATTLGWIDVSAGGGTYSTLTSTDNWQFAQFGNLVLATQANAAAQSFDLTSSTAFAALGGSPPQSRYIAIVGRFVVLSGLLSTPYRIQWSGLGDATQWTAGTNSSNYIDIPDGGIVRGVAGGEFGLIFQDATIRRMTFAPGNPVIFVIERIAEDHGLLMPYSIIRAGERTFYLSPQGFEMRISGGAPVPIGKERVDRTVSAELDTGSPQLMLGASDPRTSRVYWAYKTLNGTSGQFDKLLCYDWALDRFAPIEVTGEFIGALSQPGVTLDGLDTISTSIDALTTSLDDYPAGLTPEIAIFNTSHILGFLRGANLQATLVTAEQNGDGQRFFARGFRVLSDAPTVYGSITYRESQQAAASTTNEALMNVRGYVPQRRSTRYARGKIRIPSGTLWTFATGIEPDATTDGER